MQSASEELRFEQAAALRDRIKAIEGLANRQRVIAAVYADTDAVGFFRGAKSCFTVLHYVNGDLVDKDFELMEEPMEPDGEAVSGLVRQYYAARGGLAEVRVPARVLLGRGPGRARRALFPGIRERRCAWRYRSAATAGSCWRPPWPTPARRAKGRPRPRRSSSRRSSGCKGRWACPRRRSA